MASGVELVGTKLWGDEGETGTDVRLGNLWLRESWGKAFLGGKRGGCGELLGWGYLRKQIKNEKKEETSLIIRNTKQSRPNQNKKAAAQKKKHGTSQEGPSLNR